VVLFGDAQAGMAGSNTIVAAQTMAMRRFFMPSFMTALRMCRHQALFYHELTIIPKARKPNFPASTPGKIPL
jgi:hypothetical protein